MNQQIADIFRGANLKPPTVSTLDILKEASAGDTGGVDTGIEIADILVTAIGQAGALKWLAPAATKALVASGAMPERVAGLVIKNIVVRGVNFNLTVGGLTGGVIGIIGGGLGIAAVTIAIDAIHGSELKTELEDAIHNIYKLRTNVKLSLLKSRTLDDQLNTIKTTLSVIDSLHDFKITEASIAALIAKSAKPSIVKAQSYTAANVQKMLHEFDEERGGLTYMSDDPQS